MQLAIVKFVDSTTFGHWDTIDNVDTLAPKTCLAAGWLVEKTEKLVKVALLISDKADAMSNWIVIPAGCVLSVEVVMEAALDE